jgi:hypothetical protein
MRITAGNPQQKRGALADAVLNEDEKIAPKLANFEVRK